MNMQARRSKVHSVSKAMRAFAEVALCFVLAAAFLVGLSVDTKGSPLAWYYGGGGGPTIFVEVGDSIQDAIDSADDGWTIELAYGTHYGQDISLRGRAITLRGAVNGYGAPISTINALGYGRVFECTSGEGADTVFENLLITGGLAEGGSPDNRGGGMYCNGSSPTLTNCTFEGNSATGSGGGMYNADSSPTLTDCTFESNSANFGGGMWNYNSSSPTLTNCTFAGNSADYYGGYGGGGGMLNSSSSSPTLTNCTFTGNSAYNGGGMHVSYSSPTLTNCTFEGNSAYEGGGGMYNYQSSPTLINCTFTNNSAYEYGGGGMYNVHFGYYSSPTLTNCTFTGNSAVFGGGMFNEYSSSPTLTDTIVCSNTPYQISGNWTDNGGNCVQASCDDCGCARDSDNDGICDDDDPCPLWPYDCSEDGMTLYVSPSESIQAAILGVPDGGAISVSAGTYPETLNPLGKAITVRGIGDAGSVVISGDGIRRGVVVASGETAATVFENLTFTGGISINGEDVDGDGTADWWEYQGAGGLIINASPSFVDCTWTQNYSANSGGGLYIYGAASSVSLSGCTFDQNESVKAGGGLVVYQGAVTIDGGAFVANRSESTTFGAGGLLVSGSGSATIVGTLFDGNVATNSVGPAMTMGDDGRVDLDGVTVVNHDASSGGVIHANADGEGSIANSEVCDNLGSPLEGPIENLGGNCIGEVCNSDSDGDGTEDCVDGCPNDPNKTEPGECGCGVDETGDTDGDGIPDCIDPCPTWPYDCSSDGMTLYVSPGESIQSAIDVAQNGWSVLVEPGTFAEAIDFLGKAITVEANAGVAGEVILDGTGLDSSIVVFVNGEGPDAVLRGFTLMYGTIGSVFPLDESVRVGGAVFAYQSSPTIEACHFEANRSGFGGAIYTYNGAPTIRECSFFQNHASSNGGAVQLSRSDGGLVEDCLLFENSAVGQGGGMHLFAGTPTVRRSEILDNTSGASGGGVNWYSTGGSALFAECVITGNTAKESGGGIKTRDGFEDLTLQGTTVCDNEPQDIDGAFIDGGGNTLCICPADFNGDGVVGGGDLGIMLANWDTPMSDLDGDGTTNGADLGLLLAGWGMCP